MVGVAKEANTYLVRKILLLGILSLIFSQAISLALNTNVSIEEEDSKYVLIIKTDMPAKCYINKGEGETLSPIDSEQKLFKYTIESREQTIEGVCRKIDNRDDFKNFKIRVARISDSTQNVEPKKEREKKASKESNTFSITRIEPSDSSKVGLSDYITVSTNKNSRCYVIWGTGFTTMQNVDNKHSRILIRSITQQRGKLDLNVKCYNKEGGGKSQTIKKVTYYVVGEERETSNANSGAELERKRIKINILKKIPSLSNLFNLTDLKEKIKEKPLLGGVGGAIIIITIFLVFVIKKAIKKHKTKSRFGRENINAHQIELPSPGKNAKEKKEIKNYEFEKKIRKQSKPLIDLTPFQEFEQPEEDINKGEKEKSNSSELENNTINKERWIDLSKLINKNKDKKAKEEDAVKMLDKDVTLKDLGDNIPLSMILDALKENHKENHDFKMIGWALERLMKQKQISQDDAITLVKKLKRDKIINDFEALNLLEQLGVI